MVTETELYAGTVRRRGRGKDKATSVEGVLRDLSELRIGDPVVHAQHGIGRYQGLVELDLGEGRNEFLLLEYDGGDKLYVPVSQLAVISRYSGAQAEAAPLHKLGSGQWDRARAQGGAARCATPPPSCSRCTPGAPRARDTRSASTRTTWTLLPTASASRRPPTRPRRSRRWSRT